LEKKFGGGEAAMSAVSDEERARMFREAEARGSLAPPTTDPDGWTPYPDGKQEGD